MGEGIAGLKWRVGWKGASLSLSAATSPLAAWSSPGDSGMYLPVLWGERVAEGGYKKCLGVGGGEHALSASSLQLSPINAHFVCM